MSRKQAAGWVGAALLLCGLPVVFYLKHGFLDEMDFWAGTFGLVLFAMIEVLLFAWIFGMKRGWQEIHEGADIRIPGAFKFIIKYITPIYCIGLLLFWGIQDGIPIFLMSDRDPADVPYLWGARLMMFALTVIAVGLVAYAYRKGTLRDTVQEEVSENKEEF
jgi:SNF family Na+-dependent transporter